MPRSRTGRAAAPAVRAVAVGDVVRLSGRLIAHRTARATSANDVRGHAETYHERHLNRSKNQALIVRWNRRPKRPLRSLSRSSASQAQRFVPRALRRIGLNSRCPFASLKNRRKFSRERFKRLLKYPRMPRCSQFSEDRQEPSADLMGCGAPISPQCRSAPRKLGDIARAENWRNPEGVSSLGHHGSVREPFPHGVLPQSHPAQGMLLRSSIDICPKELTRGLRGYFNSLLEGLCHAGDTQTQNEIGRRRSPRSARLDGGRSGIRH